MEVNGGVGDFERSAVEKSVFEPVVGEAWNAHLSRVTEDRNQGGICNLLGNMSWQRER